MLLEEALQKVLLQKVFHNKVFFCSGQNLNQRPFILWLTQHSQEVDKSMN